MKMVKYALNNHIHFLAILADLYVATGELARFDQNGDSFIIGRKKEVFKYCGFPVTPSEIEEFLNELDGVEDSCVVPIQNTSIYRPLLW